jgi:hypothetical protein
VGYEITGCHSVWNRLKSLNPQFPLLTTFFVKWLFFVRLVYYVAWVIHLESYIQVLTNKTLQLSGFLEGWLSPCFELPNSIHC